ncbi:MAG: hypothetical protein F6K00_19510 [Leptolyngbya sp. SIOISBB]|nr:hypothetical protein [Leptolyngbya sp. SIOISBB]
MTSGEAWFEYGDICNSVACWQWTDWVVAIAFVAMCVFGLWLAFTDPRMKQRPPKDRRGWWF